MTVMRAVLLGLLMILPACTPQAAERTAAPVVSDSSVHPVSGLPVIPLTVHAEGRQPHTVQVEVARSNAEQSRGLMFRTEMGADEGMLFPTERPQMRSFWMKNTVLPLDIIFIGADRRVTNVAANTTPYSEESVPSSAPVIAVLELNAGRAAQLGIGPGTRIDW